MSSLYLALIDQHSYLGVTLTSNMSFSPHIQKISAKATRMLNFLRRNLYNCSKEIKSRAYLTLVHPILEYASPVWDPHLVKDRDQIEKVQQAAARWVSSDYCWSSQSSVSSMLNLLNWPIHCFSAVRSRNCNFFTKPSIL